VSSHEHGGEDSGREVTADPTAIPLDVLIHEARVGWNGSSRLGTTMTA
jgi:hypothetical protein